MNTSMTEMEDTANAMLERLHGTDYRCRTGILVLTAEQYEHIEDHAVQLHADAVNYLEYLLSRLPPGSQFVHITAETVERDLYEIAISQKYADYRLVYDIDITLARLGGQQRKHFWGNLFERFPHHQPLVLVLPETALPLLIDDSDLSNWRQSGRLASMTTREVSA